MRRHRPHPHDRVTERFSAAVTKWTGSTMAFLLAMGVILLWVVTGPMFGFSDTWQLVINTGTTIVTFLMVFLIQRAQNKDSQAVHLKLNELVAAVEGASGRLLNAEDFSEQELKLLHEHYCALSQLAEKGGELRHSHSVEEATQRYLRKRSWREASSKKQALGESAAH